MMVLDGVCRLADVTSDRVGGRVFFPGGGARGWEAPTIAEPFMALGEMGMKV